MAMGQVSLAMMGLYRILTVLRWILSPGVDKLGVGHMVLFSSFAINQLFQMCDWLILDQKAMKIIVVIVLMDSLLGLRNGGVIVTERLGGDIILTEVDWCV